MDMYADSDESFSGFSDIGLDIDVNLAGEISSVSSVSSVSSDNIVGELETAWTDELAAIPACEFNAAGATLGILSFCRRRQTNSIS